jgi:hypothetical protein
MSFVLAELGEIRHRHRADVLVYHVLIPEILGENCEKVHRKNITANMAW